MVKVASPVPSGDANVPRREPFASVLNAESASPEISSAGERTSATPAGPTRRVVHRLPRRAAVGPPKLRTQF